MNERQILNQGIIDEFRANAGVVGGQFANTPLLLLTTTGAKSGESRISPLAYAVDGDRLLVAAANGGRDMHAGWYYNILADPFVTVEVGSERFRARATVAEGDERERVYGVTAAALPIVASLQGRTSRQIPLVILERVD